MTKTLFKNTLREIRNTRARFLSILAIIALGVGFFAGIKATSPSMINMAEEYYSDANLMDYRLVSTVGFDSDDVDYIKNLDGVTDVMPSYFADVIINYGDTGNAVRIISVPKAYGDNAELNTLTVKEGRLPEKTGEIVVDSGTIGAAVPSLGDKVKIEPQAGDTQINEVLDVDEYTVVGIVQSPLYISYERGMTNIGSGKLAMFMYVSPQDFKVEKYTELYVKTKYSDSNISPFSAEYNDSIEEFSKTLETAADHRCNVFKTDVIGKAQKEIDEGFNEYYEQKDNADTELENSKEQLLQAQAEYDSQIASAQKTMDNAQQQIIQGEAELSAYVDEFNSKISAGEAELADSESKIEKAREEYSRMRDEFNRQTDAAQAEIDRGYEEYEKAADLYYSTLKPYLLYQIGTIQANLDTVQGNIDALEAELSDYEISSPDEAVKIAELKSAIAALNAQAEALRDSLDIMNYSLYTAEQALEYTGLQLQLAQGELNQQKAEGELKLQQGLAEIEQGEQQLNDGKQKLENSKLDGEDELRAARAEITQAKAELEAAREEFEEQKASGKVQLDEGWQEYRDALKTTEEKLADARTQLEEAQDKLNSTAEAQWYIYDRSDNPGYADFKSNTDRIDAVASVFPTFFLLVAVLVCLTTMTRLIEEKRTEIGTLKALGYSGGAVTCKFLIYATLAGVVGSLIGVLCGIFTLPFIIYNAYKMMYSMAELTLVVDYLSIILGVAAALLCTTTVALVICRKSLRHKPASLMRPKAPKPGKRILLERVGFLWKRLNFTSKVTARNLFRYKSRFLMTILGVAGCTALIVAAFGLKNSFVPMTQVQFNDIFKYQAVLIPENAGTREELNDLCAAVYNDDDVKEALLAKQTSITVSTDKAVKDKNTNIFVPENLSAFESLISLRTRIGGIPIELDDDSVVITEKMASELGVSPDGKINLSLDGTEAEVTVGGVCENYIYNYVYISPNLYSDVFGDELRFNSMFMSLSDGAVEDTFGKRYIERDDIAAVTFTSTGVNEFDNMLSSLNIVVLVMIVMAGALAFVVLYNLTNINIEERIREIATIKVLGFYNRETAGYIYRESIILTLLGIAAGLAMGVVLTGFVVRTVEVDNVMFGRDIFLTTYLYAIGLTALFSVLVNVVMYRKMKKIDMVESLKSIE